MKLKTRQTVKVVKLISVAISVFCLLALLGCAAKIKDYTGKPILNIRFEKVDYNGGYTDTYVFDFESNTVKRRGCLPSMTENSEFSIIANFSDEKEKVLINKLYSYGLFNIKDNYASPPGISDGGGWSLAVEYSDGTTKNSSGSNNSPTAVFNKCAEAFYDICGEGVVASVPQKYYTPPNISYAIHTTVGINTTSQGATSLAKRGNYKWNGFEENMLNYFQMNQSHPFPYELDENTSYEFVLYTANYRDYDRFKKCTVTAYDCNEEMTGEEIVVEKGWFKQIEFDLQFNKIYVIKLSFKNGDFVEYTFNTKLN